MRRPFVRLTSTALWAGVLGCSSELPIGDAPAVSAPAERSTTTEERRELASRRDFLRHAVRQRMARKFPPPSRRRTQKCPDDEIAAATKDGESATLALIVQDERIQARSLVPLRLTRFVSSPDLAAIDATSSWGVTAPLARVRAAVRQLEAAQALRYAAVHHVIHYSQPKRIRKLNKRRPEWVPGWIISWLVVHDLESGSPQCQIRVQARNDVSSAPLSARLKSDTRRELVAALGQELRRATPRAVARISGTLRVAEVEDASERTAGPASQNR